MLLSDLKINYILFYVYRYFPSMCVCALHACLVLMESRRGHQIPLKLELEMVVSHPVGAGN